MVRLFGRLVHSLRFGRDTFAFDCDAYAAWHGRAPHMTGLAVFSRDDDAPIL